MDPTRTAEMRGLHIWAKLIGRRQACRPSFIFIYVTIQALTVPPMKGEERKNSTNDDAQLWF